MNAVQPNQPLKEAVSTNRHSGSQFLHTKWQTYYVNDDTKTSHYVKPWFIRIVFWAILVSLWLH